MRNHSARSKPKWWQLYLTFPLLAGLFVIDSRSHIAEGGHEAIQLGSLALEFILVQLWLRRNASALRHLDDARLDSTTIVHLLPEASPTQVGEEPPLLIPWPIEIKGVLGDTFEWERPDVKLGISEGGEGTEHRESK